MSLVCETPDSCWLPPVGCRLYSPFMAEPYPTFPRQECSSFSWGRQAVAQRACKAEHCCRCLLHQGRNHVWEVSPLLAHEILDSSQASSSHMSCITGNLYYIMEASRPRMVSGMGARSGVYIAPVLLLLVMRSCSPTCMLRTSGLSAGCHSALLASLC